MFSFQNTYVTYTFSVIRIPYQTSCSFLSEKSLRKTHIPDTRSEVCRQSRMPGICHSGRFVRYVYSTDTFHKSRRAHRTTCILLSVVSFWNIYIVYTFLQISLKLGISCSPLGITSFCGIYGTHTFSETGRKLGRYSSCLSVIWLVGIYVTYTCQETILTPRVSRSFLGMFPP